jgi:hypothetical protein
MRQQRPRIQSGAVFICADYLVLLLETSGRQYPSASGLAVTAYVQSLPAGNRRDFFATERLYATNKNVVSVGNVGCVEHG